MNTSSVRVARSLASALALALVVTGCRHEPRRRAHTEAVSAAPRAPAPGGPGDPGPVALRKQAPPPGDNGGERFDAEVRQLYREVACGGSEPIADPVRAKV